MTTLDDVPARSWSPADEVELDVRDDLRQGREPFSRIMAAVKALAPGQVLHLRAIFEPLPLYRVLAQRGYAAVSQAHAPDDWSVWFHPATPDAPPGAAPRVRSATAPPTAIPATDDVMLDVRGLTPPEPLQRTLRALETLPAHATLVQLNDRVPQFLLPLLHERGFAYTVDASASDGVRVLIRRAGASAARAGSSSTPESLPMTATTPIELDVRVIAPREKHPTIFRTFDALESGQSMVILNDHDPRPLRYQLAAERPDTFDWTYEAEGPELWRVRISRR